MKKFIVLVITVVMAMSLLSGSLVVLAEEAEQPGCFVDEANDTAIPAEETEPSVESAVVTELPSEAVIADPVVPAAVPENAVIAEPVENAASQVSGNVISTT